MGSKAIRIMYYRLILLCIVSFSFVYDHLYQTTIVDYIINHKLFNTISILHLFWIIILIEMFKIIFPKFNRHSYNGKHLKKHFIPVNNYNKEQLIYFTKQNNKKAMFSVIFWIILNTPFVILYFLGYLKPQFFYWLFFLYYFFDTICINIFCVFHMFIMRNKCCNECRIYNWSYFMYCIPLLFIPTIWNYLLILISIIILIQWEISLYRHPERFSSISNSNLQCQHCPYECRYQFRKTNIFIQKLNSFGNLLYKRLLKK